MFVTVIAEEDEMKVLSVCNCKCKAVFPNIFLLEDPFWAPKITTDPYILAYAYMTCPDVKVAKIKNLYLRSDISMLQIHTSCIRNNECYYLTFNNMSVARFADTGNFLTRYSGHTK